MSKVDYWNKVEPIWISAQIIQ